MVCVGEAGLGFGGASQGIREDLFGECAAGSIIEWTRNEEKRIAGLSPRRPLDLTVPSRRAEDALDLAIFGQGSLTTTILENASKRCTRMISWLR